MRHRVNGRKSARQFNRRADKTARINLSAPFRGGIRL